MVISYAVRHFMPFSQSTFPSVTIFRRFPGELAIRYPYSFPVRLFSSCRHVIGAWPVIPCRLVANIFSLALALSRLLMLLCVAVSGGLWSVVPSLTLAWWMSRKPSIAESESTHSWADSD